MLGEKEPYSSYQKRATPETLSGIHAYWKKNHIAQVPTPMAAGGEYGIRELVLTHSIEIPDAILDTKEILDIDLPKTKISLSLSQAEDSNLKLMATTQHDGENTQYQRFDTVELGSRFELKVKEKTVCTLTVINLDLGENPKIYLRVDFPPDDNLEA